MSKHIAPPWFAERFQAWKARKSPLKQAAKCINCDKPMSLTKDGPVCYECEV